MVHVHELLLGVVKETVIALVRRLSVVWGRGHTPMNIVVIRVVQLAKSETLACLRLFRERWRLQLNVTVSIYFVTAWLLRYVACVHLLTAV